MSYRVVTALVVAHTPQGDVYTYRDGVVPDSVPDDEIQRLLGEGFLEEVPVEDEATSDEPPVGEQLGVDLEAMNLEDLRKLAEEQSIDLAGATRKADIVAAIQAAKN